MKWFKRSLSLVALLFLLFFGYMKITNRNINDIGLSVLSWVKKIKGNSVDLKKIEVETSAIVDHKPWSSLLNKHVDNTGHVNYKGFVMDVEKLDTYLTILSNHPPAESWPENEQLAYWINAYNAFTVKLIVDHYPLKSIKEISDGLVMIGSPWDIKFFKINKIDFDLNTIEHEILRKQFSEPRIHFAINCASVSCPMLRNEAYLANRIDQQLEEQAKAFVNDVNRNFISKEELKLSKIFSWFQSDFTKNGSTLIDYIGQYSEVNLESHKIEFLDYDWNLNE